MTSSGSSSSAARAEPAPGPAEVVIGIPADGGPGAAEAVRAITSALAGQAGPARCRVIVARPRPRARASLAAPGVTGSEVSEVSYELQPSDTLQVPFHGLTGRARALHAIVQAAHARGARGCLLLDPRSAATLRGLGQLLEPLARASADFVAPVYERHPFSGALVHGLVYPTFRALYGVRLRCPICPDFGCSRELIETVLDDPVWQSDGGQVGIDLALAATAATGGLRIAQVLVGPGPAERSLLDLGTTLSQVVGFLFSDMERRAPEWQRIRRSRALPTLGDPRPVPQAPQADATALIESFRLGSRELQDIWAEVLPPLAILQWRRVATLPADTFRVDDALWARTIYDFAMGYRLRVIPRDHLLRSLAPLYRAWLASFVVEVRHLPPAEAEARIERLADVFEAEKPYLVSQWRWPERFRPVKLRR